jgi:deoxyribose-phosphate aldolase
MTAIGRRAVRLEHRLTAPNASHADLDAAMGLVLESEAVAALVVSPWLVKIARRTLGRSRIRLGTVIGYGHGGQLLAVKAFEASKALEQGATQIDFVLNGGALLSGEEETVYNDMLAVVDMTHSALAISAVIIEAASLPEALVRKACRLAERAGADQVVTCMETATARHAINRTSLLRDSVGPRVLVKAAGRFRDATEVRAAVDAGATRVAASFTTDLLRAAVEAIQPVAAR